MNAPEEDGATPLHWAVRWDDAAAVELLLNAGADPDAANDYGVTPLSLACINRNPAVVAKLLSAGADPNAATSMGETVLMTCAGTGSAAAVSALLDHDAANVNARESSQGQTALMWAVAQGYPDVVQMLLEHGAAIHTRTKSRSLLVSLEGGAGGTDPGEVKLGGFTPLLFAARQGSVESARLLLDAGADVNDTAPDGSSALVVAGFSGHGELGAFLLERGADPDAGGAGYAPLHTAVLRGDAEFVQALLVHGADPNVRMTRGSRVPRRTNWWGAAELLRRGYAVPAGRQVCRGGDHAHPARARRGSVTGGEGRDDSADDGCRRAVEQPGVRPPRAGRAYRAGPRHAGGPIAGTWLLRRSRWSSAPT